jgi:deazaflavin-dependent oxidoreductase (nitroreductase family)
MRTLALRTCSLSLLTLSAVLFTRAGFGPVGGPERRRAPCAVSRCRHNAILALLPGLLMLRLSRRHDQSSPARRLGLVRRFNKHILNPFMLWLVARRRTYYAVLQHTGRRSGKRYVTPVVAKPTPDGVIIPLPYGPDTDWCRNVLAAGGCRLTLAGGDLTLSGPEVVEAAVGGALVPAANAWLWRRLGVRRYLRLRQVQVPASASPLPAVAGPVTASVTG